MAMTLIELEVYVLKVENRLETVEGILNTLQLVLKNVASTEQLRQINLIRQRELTELKEQLDALDAEFQLVKNEVFS